jgi:hypothetical protein
MVPGQCVGTPPSRIRGVAKTSKKAEEACIQVCSISCVREKRPGVAARRCLVPLSRTTWSGRLLLKCDNGVECFGGIECELHRCGLNNVFCKSARSGKASEVGIEMDPLTTFITTSRHPMLPDEYDTIVGFEKNLSLSARPGYFS